MKSSLCPAEAQRISVSLFPWGRQGPGRGGGWHSADNSDCWWPWGRLCFPVDFIYSFIHSPRQPFLSTDAGLVLKSQFTSLSLSLPSVLNGNNCNCVSGFYKD